VSDRPTEKETVEAYAAIFKMIGDSAERMTRKVQHLYERLEKSFERIDRLAERNGGTGGGEDDDG
jgi:hypothetical protein